MSLDVYLEVKKQVPCNCGKNHVEETEEVYCANITHNLGTMADKAGIYEALWRPYRLKEGYYSFYENKDEHESAFEDAAIVLAKDIIPVIEKGLEDMKKRPEYYSKFNAENGWGLYEHFIPFIENYLAACKEYPEAIVRTSR